MKLDESLAEFEGLDAEDRLQLLIDFGEMLPPLTAEQRVQQQAGSCRVQECQTEVFLWTDVQDGKLQLAAHVPERSPTVRGFVALLVTSLHGVPAEEAARLPENLASRLGLTEVLGMTRTRGFAAIFSRIKQAAVKWVAEQETV